MKCSYMKAGWFDLTTLPITCAIEQFWSAVAEPLQLRQQSAAPGLFNRVGFSANLYSSANFETWNEKILIENVLPKLERAQRLLEMIEG